MIIGSISENKTSEKRVSITPEISKKYISNGFKKLKRIADHIGIKDEEFQKEDCFRHKRKHFKRVRCFITNELSF